MFKNLNQVFIFFTLLILSQPLVGQSLHFGLPISEFYPYQIDEINAVSNNTEDEIYFSTKDKLVLFQGYFNEILTEIDPVESLIQFDSTLLFGGKNSYGEINQNNNGQFSLKNKFQNTDGIVTHIASSNYGNFILSNNQVFHFKDKISKKYSFPGIVDYLGNVNNSTLLHDDANGLSIFVGSKFKIVNNSRFLSSMEVVEIKSMGSGEYIVATKNNGLYKFDGESFSEFGKEYLMDKKILDLEIINISNGQNEIVLITEKNELISLNVSGSLVQEKLFTNDLFSLHQDNENRLYVFSSEGIHVLFYNLPFQIIDLSPDPLHGPVTIYDDKFYWGTNNGLFYSRIQETGNLVDARIRVKDTEGKVGKLDVVNNTLLMSHEDGLYDILPRIGARFIPDERFFGFENLANDYVISFGDRNTYLLKKKRNRWRIVKIMEDFPIHPKSVVLDNRSNLWLVDRDYSIKQYLFDSDNEEFELISSKSNPDKVELFELNNEVIQVKKDGLFEYNYESELFEISDELTAVFATALDIDQIINDQYGNIWFIQDGKVGLFRSTEDNHNRYRKIDIDLPFSDAREIYPYDKSNIFINNGANIVKLDLDNYSTRVPEKIAVDCIKKIKKDNKIEIIYSSADLYSSIGSINLDRNESLSILLGDYISPGNEYEYSISEQKEEFNWQVSPVNSTINIKGLESGDYYLNIRRNNYVGYSNNIMIPLQVGKSISDGNNILYLMGIIALLLMGIAFIVGYNIGNKKKLKNQYLNTL